MSEAAQTAIDQAKDIGALQADMANIKATVSEMDRKLDELVSAANMGKGAWWASVKVGGIIVTILAALAWVWQHVPHPFRN
jgi:hypothetical protein